MSVKATILNKIDKQGETQIFIRITRNRKSYYIATKYKIKPRNWNSKKGLPRGNNHDLRADIKALIKTIEEYQDKPIEAIEKALNKPRINNSFFDLADRVIEEHRMRNAYQTMKTYRCIISKLRRYTKKDITIESINVSFLYQYEAYLTGFNAPNTVHKDLKTIRAIYYRAIREGLVSRESNPFFIFKLKTAPVNRPKLTLEEVHRLANVELDGVLKIVRDVFMFGIYSGGMRIGDLLRLKVSNINSNSLSYKVSKTGKYKTVNLIPKAMEIIATYSGKKDQSEYLFPFLTKGLSELEIAQVMPAKTIFINKRLKKIAKLCGIQKSISTHIARHTFADLARRNGANLYDISKALGHSSLKVTEQYLSTFDEDSTNRALKGLF